MISILQKSAEVCRVFSRDGSSLFPCISAIHFESDNEIECFNFAVQQKFITTYTGHTGEQSFSLEKEGKIELSRLLEKRDAIQREEKLLQYAQEQAKNSSWAFYISLFALIGSGIYLAVAIAVAVGTFYYPVRVVVLNPIITPVNVREHEQCPIPDEAQKGNPCQRNKQH